MLSVILTSVDLNADEKSKFESIYNKYKSALFYQAMNIVKNENDAEDVLQNSFIKIAKNIKSIGGLNSKETLSFLIVITKNTAYDFMRKSSKIIELPLSKIEETADSDNEIENLISKIQYQRIVLAINNIPSPYSEVLYLHYVKDYSINKTALLLGRKSATVKMQLIRGKRILIEKLTEVLYG